MSEAAVSTQQTRGQETGLFDDRVDVDPTISNGEVIRLIGRSLGYLAAVKKLFAAKLGLALIALLPGLIAPWTGISSIR